VKQFDKLGAVILGISPDSVEAQKKFESKHKLHLPLLSDEDKSVTTAYGCFGDKKMYGRVVQGITRTTYLIDPKGKIAKVWSNVRVDGHAEKVLDALRELGA
jgi:thioredoxin-dependent peroxiredoxin